MVVEIILSGTVLEEQEPDSTEQQEQELLYCFDG